MKLVIQRVSEASVSVDGEVISSIEKGLLVLLGIGVGDSVLDVEWMVKKLLGLRIFSDSDGKMNLSVQDIEGGVLVVSQFTLYGDCKKGNRPSFVQAMPPAEAEAVYERFLSQLRAQYPAVQAGQFGAMMDVQLVNDGPVTLILET